jgi:hypothetical protein
VIGGPAVLAEIYRMTFQQMVGRYDLVCGLFRHDLLQHVPVCALRQFFSAAFSIENNCLSGSLSEFCFQKRTQVINLSSLGAAN